MNGMGRCLLAFILLCGLASSAVAQDEAREVPTAQPQIQLSFAPIVKQTAPAVVNIYTRKLVQQRMYSPFMNDPFFQHFFGGGMPQGMNRKRLENSLGSGVLVRADGLIVTSNHVIDGADEITVVLSDRREFDAKLVTSDDRSDLALLRIDTKGEKLPFLTLKDSDDVQVGDLVIAIGNPFGVGQTVTSGIVSAIARTNLDINDINYYIQTDAAINPGNSGGALVSTDGRLIGINSAIFTKDGGNMGLGFAVPSNMVQATIAGISDTRKNIVRAWTGLGGQAVDAELARSLGLVRPVGLIVNTLNEASPARAAGVKIGDVLVAINGHEIEDPAAFNYRIATLGVGQDVTLAVMRKGHKETVRFKLIAPPENPPRNETLIKRGGPLAGIRVANLSPAVSEEYGVRGDDGGVVIIGASETAGFSGFGLGRGDIILEINGKTIKRVADLLSALKEDTIRWKITIQRGDSIINMFVGGR